MAASKIQASCSPATPAFFMGICKVPKTAQRKQVLLEVILTWIDLSPDTESHQCPKAGDLVPYPSLLFLFWQPKMSVGIAVVHQECKSSQLTT